MTLGPTSPTTNRLPAQPYEYVAAAKQAPAPAAAARRRRTRGVGEPSPAGKFWIYLLLVAGAALLLIPFVFMVLSSVKTEAEVAAGSFELPDKVLLRNYPDALRKMGFLPALANTVVITTMCVVGQVISSSLVGFGFARFKFRGRDALFLVMLSTMMLPAQVTMIPVFVLFRYLGWIDSFWPLIVPQWLAAPFFVFMFRQFFSQIPEELMEAARIDGAGNWTIYWRLMMPLCGPVVAIVAIYTFLATWNDFMGPLIYLNSPENRTLALALNAFKGQYGVTDAHLLMAASAVCMLPCIVLFFAMQKYFVESVAMTGLKS
jgi:ABC-type glycerol-3-phosphate transport system permease component